MSKKTNSTGKQVKSVSYAKWGYIFILPFFITYFIWTFIPQVLTIYYSFFEYYRVGLKVNGPTFNGIQNYINLFKANRSGVIPIVRDAGNTIILWALGAIPQFVIAMLFAVFFTSARLKIKGQAFFKTVMYMPNLIMASAFAMLFFSIFSEVGPVSQLLQQLNILDKPLVMDASAPMVRGLIATMNFLMWFGNTMIVLMAGIMGIDNSLFEAAAIDGANSPQVFFKITLPLLMPILNYSVITAMLGGINMYDVPQILTKGQGFPNHKTTTLIMELSEYLGTSKNYGMGGALSVLIFIFSAILIIFVYSFLQSQYKDRLTTSGSMGKKKKGGRK